MILMTQKHLWAAAVLFLAALGGGAGAAEERHTLFNPVPKDRLRPLSADRPDSTESPYTVDAGHVQLEADIAAWFQDKAQEDGARVRRTGWAFAVTNVKLGLTPNVDLQLVVETYRRERTSDRDAGTRTVMEGFGDLTVRTKINVWGNDGGETAFAVMPFVLFPTNQDDLGGNDVEGGIIFPFATELPCGWGLGLQLEFDLVRDSADTGYELDISHTIVLGHDIVGDLAGFIEIFSLFPGESGADWVGTLNAGLTYGVNDDLQLDIGVQIGISRAADDLAVFTGVTRRW